MDLRRLSLATLGLAMAVACTTSSADQESGDAAVCAQANEAVEACLGVPPDPPLDDCDEDGQAAAQELLDGLAAAGCDNVPEGKEDSLLCELLIWDPLGWCADPPPPLGPEPAGEPTRFPIILAHGFNTSTTNFWRFNDVDIALADDGHVVTLGSVPPFDTPQVRAGFLADQVDALLEETGAEKVNMICFSMGGIDCRWLVSPDGLDYGAKVATVTTLSSPHRGTAVADAALGVLPDADDAKAIDALATLWGMTFSEVADDSHLVAALEAMSERGMVDFNATVGDHPDVFYQSWAGVSSVGGLPHPDRNAEAEACTDENGQVQQLRHPGTHDVMDPLLVGAAGFVAHGLQLRPNDGVSTVESAKYGLFRGCIPADHLDEAGQIDDVGADHRTGFDYLRFYRNVAFDLAARGF